MKDQKTDCVKELFSLNCGSLNINEEFIFPKNATCMYQETLKICGNKFSTLFRSLSLAENIRGNVIFIPTYLPLNSTRIDDG